MAAWQRPACTIPPDSTIDSPEPAPAPHWLGWLMAWQTDASPLGQVHTKFCRTGEKALVCLYPLCHLVLKQKHLLSSYLQRQMLLTAFSVFRARTQPSSLMVHRASSLQPPSPEMQTATRKIPGGGKDSSAQSHQTQVVSLLRCNRN